MRTRDGVKNDTCTEPIVEGTWAIRYYHNASLCLTNPADTLDLVVDVCANGNISDPSPSQLWTYYANSDTHVRLKDTQMCLQVGEVAS